MQATPESVRSLLPRVSENAFKAGPIESHCNKIVGREGLRPGAKWLHALALDSNAHAEEINLLALSRIRVKLS